MTTPPAGSATVCFDTTGLIHFNAIGRLSMLGAWFPHAYAPAVVIEEEIRAHLVNHPENQAILDAPWLHAVELTDLDDLKDVAEVHRRYGRQAGQDRGEAEVVVLCARNGWTGIIDDTQGQRAARDYKAAYCSILTMLLIAAAHDLVDPNEAWTIHVELEASRRGSYSALTAQAVHRPIFHACIQRFTKILNARAVTWPHLLAHPAVDGLVIQIRNESS